MAIPQWLADEISGEYPPWRRLSEHSESELADIRFPIDSIAEVESLSQEATALGLRTETSRLLLLSQGASELISLVIDCGKFSLAAYGVLKMVNDSPTQLKAFLAKLPSIRRNKDLHPGLYLGNVADWLDKKYGANSWKYDPDAISVKQRGSGGPTVFAIVELNRNEKILLLVSGDAIEEVPTNLARFWQDSDVSGGTST